MSSEKFETKYRRRSRFMWGLLYFSFFLLSFRLVSLHVFPDERAITRASKQYWTYIKTSSKRGIISDYHNVPLAISIPSFSFFIDPLEWEPENAKKLKDFFSEKTIQRLSQIHEGRFLWVARKLTGDSVEKIRRLNLPGLYEIEEGKRVYPQGEDAAHILGYCDIDEKGLAGIELVYNSVLYSPPANHLIAKTAGGKMASILFPEATQTLREPGRVCLTIDSRIQHILNEELQEAIRKEKARWGAILCIDVTSGAIRGMTSWPVFDANHRETLANPEALRNNAIGRIYEPGSTLKPVILGIALELGLVGWEEEFSCPGRIRVADGWISEIYGRGHGKIAPQDIIAKSSNVGMAQIGARIKPQDGYDYLRFWGFGSQTGIQFPGEEKGILHKPEQWLGVVPANIAIGQGIAVTPLQLLSAVGAIANGGKLYQPYLVESIENEHERFQYRGSSHVRNHVLTEVTARRLRESMLRVVEQGSGRAAKISGISVAGKTGTAQIAQKGAYAEDSYVASFVGFWPAEDPVLSLLVIIGEPQSGNDQGGKVAAPVFRKIVEKISAFEPEFGQHGVYR